MVRKKHPKMPMSQRAKQFMPFSLGGLGAALAVKEKEVEEKNRRKYEK